MALTSKICAYDNHWPAAFTAEQARIAQGFGVETGKSEKEHHPQ